MSYNSRYQDSPVRYPRRAFNQTQAYADNSDSANDSDDATPSSSSPFPPRTSTELARHDRALLDEEEERENLLLGRQPAPDDRTQSRSFFNNLGRPREKRKESRKGSSRPYMDEKGELLYEMEEGGPRGGTPGSSEEEADRDIPREKVGVIKPRTKTPLITRIFKYSIINILAAAALIGIAFGAFKATRLDRSHSLLNSYRSNGSHDFAPTTIVVSLDGFRADFLQRNLTPTLNRFIQEGVSPPYMTPSFPSVTFPNHYTLVTGLYPESHGIVGNTFFDPDLQEEFYYTHPDAMQAKWWNGEPLWVTAEKQGVRVATHMWPGSEASIGEFVPTFVDKFNISEVLSAKVDRVLGLLDKPGPDMLHIDTVVDDQRPQLVIAYVPDVDEAGHLYGPNSTEIRSTITAVDDMLASILAGLHVRNLTDIVNLVVVSDHGMATTSNQRLIQLEDLVDPNLIAHIDGWPHYGLRPKDPAIVDMLYDHLIKEAQVMDGFDVYTKDTMPERYHFTANDRIAPLWIIPRTGWAIVTREEYDVAEGRRTGAVYHPRGIHGYDHEHPLMRAIFVARGPAFPHQGGSRVDIFQNTEVYNIICDSIGVRPKDNNGTLRLPFNPTGLHPGLGSGGGGEDGDQVQDFPSHVPGEDDDSSSSAPEYGSGSENPASSESSAHEGQSGDHDQSDDSDSPGTGTGSENEYEDEDEDEDSHSSTEQQDQGAAPSEEKQGPQGFLSWLKQKIDDAKAWLADQFSGKYSGKKPGGPDRAHEFIEVETPQGQEVEVEVVEVDGPT